MQITFSVKVTMWKTITIILCVLIVRSNPLEPNSPLLESKIGRRESNAEYTFEYYDQTELKSVVYIMIGYCSTYHMVYMANMISPKVGLTATQIQSNIDGQIINLGRVKYVAATYNKEYLPIDKFINIDKYIKRNMGVHLEGIRRLQMLVLEDSVRFSMSPFPFPLLGTKINEHKAMTLGVNFVERYPPEDGFILKVDVCVKAEEEDRFFFELCDINMQFLYDDEGNPVFSGDKFVGILTDYRTGTVIKVLEYKSYFEEIATRKNLGELYLAERS